MLVKEYRIVMPLTLDEYQRGQIFSVAESAKRETGGGDGIEIVSSEAFEDIVLDNGVHLSHGQYTIKKYHIDHKVPNFVRLLTPKGALDLKEECWNAFPYSRTVISNDFLGERLRVVVESNHLPDRGDTENALNLSTDALAAREVVTINIGDDLILNSEEEEEFEEEENPRRYRSAKTLRGPLGNDWMNECQPVMTCYKVVSCEFKVFGLQSRLENFIQKNEQLLFTIFHRRMFCWIDDWIDLSLEESRKHEENIAKNLDELRESGSLKGISASE